jgi:fatty-acyl-CoA synthase
MSMGELLAAAADRYPDKPAIVFKQTRITYAELRRRADAFARCLLALGLGAGDHVVLWMPNSIEWCVANLGIARIGAVTVMCNSRYKAFEVEYLVRQSDARAVVMMDRFDTPGIDYLEILRGIVPDVLWPQDRRIVSAKFPELRHVIVFGAARDPGCLSAEDVQRRGERREAGALEKIRVVPEAPVAILYTSGTTGALPAHRLRQGSEVQAARVGDREVRFHVSSIVISADLRVEHRGHLGLPFAPRRLGEENRGDVPVDSRTSPPRSRTR